jgi:hypothetical protein
MKPTDPEGQLYHMGIDPGETKNAYEKKPERVAQLLTLLKQDVNRGRSTDGADVENDVPVEKIILWKSGRDE